MKNSEEFDDKMIKDFFAKDNVISLKANNVFEETLNQISNMKKTKNKSAKIIIQKWMSVAACFLILLISANTYARSNGYDNIFFMIKNVFINEEVAGAENLLSDREITLSYIPIEIADDFKIQIQKIVLEEKSATLYIFVDTGRKENRRYKIYDENNKLIADYRSTRSIEDCFYTEELKFKNSIKENSKLKLEIYEKNQKLLATININIDNKEILINGEDIVLNRKKTELKYYIESFVFLNDDKIKNKTDRIIYAAQRINNGFYDLDDIIKTINLFYNDKIDIVNGKIKLDKDSIFAYKKASDGISELIIPSIQRRGICTEIKDISYVDNNYKVKFIYCISNYDEENDTYEDIDNLTKYEATAIISNNLSSDYPKYKLLSLSNGEKIE